MVDPLAFFLLMTCAFSFEALEVESGFKIWAILWLYQFNPLSDLVMNLSIKVYWVHAISQGGRGISRSTSCLIYPSRLKIGKIIWPVLASGLEVEVTYVSSGPKIWELICDPPSFFSPAAVIWRPCSPGNIATDKGSLRPWITVRKGAALEISLLRSGFQLILHEQEIKICVSTH